MRKLIVIGIAVAVFAPAAMTPAAEAKMSPCVPQTHRHRCEQLDTCESAGATAFKDPHLTQADRLRFYRHCVWLEERWTLKNAGSKNSSTGYVLHKRKHRLRKVQTKNYPNLRRAECEQAGKKSYC